MSTHFNKVLIANRGEIALRVLRALQALDIASVAIYHHSDRHSPVVQQADEAVEITGDSPSAAHLDISQIVAICERLEVDAVHPGGSRWRLRSTSMPTTPTVWKR